MCVCVYVCVCVCVCLCVKQLGMLLLNGANAALFVHMQETLAWQFRMAASDTADCLYYTLRAAGVRTPLLPSATSVCCLKLLVYEALSY